MMSGTTEFMIYPMFEALTECTCSDRGACVPNVRKTDSGHRLASPLRGILVNWQGMNGCKTEYDDAFGTWHRHIDCAKREEGGIMDDKR
jgi:hypothetical protein